jgi:hypothetical protein
MDEWALSNYARAFVVTQGGIAMRMRNFVFISILGLVPASLHAATEFSGGLVPMDVVREFAGGTLYKSVPDGFPAISLPPGIDLRLIGSTTETYNQKVVLRTTLTHEALYEQLRTALTAQGWTDLSSTSFSRVFMRFCHDQHGILSINTNSSSGGGLRVDVNRSTFPSSVTCSQQQALADSSKGWSDFYDARFPVLEVPAETVTTGPTPSIIRGDSSSSSGSRTEINRTGIIEVPRASAATIHEHFARQMANQGWKMDSSATGERSGTSVWIKSAMATGLSTELVEMLVTLSIVRGAGDVYGISVKFQSPPTAGSAFGFFNTTSSF